MWAPTAQEQWLLLVFTLNILFCRNMILTLGPRGLSSLEERNSALLLLGPSFVILKSCYQMKLLLPQTQKVKRYVLIFLKSQIIINESFAVISVFIKWYYFWFSDSLTVEIIHTLQSQKTIIQKRRFKIELLQIKKLILK